MIAQLRLFGQGAVVEPVEQGFAEVADGTDLRVVDVGVDESGDEDTSTEVDHLGVGMVRGRTREIGAGDDQSVIDDECDV